MRIIRATVWVIGVMNLLTSTPPKWRPHLLERVSEIARASSSDREFNKFLVLCRVHRVAASTCTRWQNSSAKKLCITKSTAVTPGGGG